MVIPIRENEAGGRGGEGGETDRERERDEMK